MKRLIYILLFFACAMPLGGQNRTQNGALTGQKKYPLLNYFELACPEPAVVSEWKDVKGVQISWGSVDSSYAKTSVPVSKVVKALRLDAWRGETVMAEALVWSKKAAPDISFSLDCPFPAETGFVRYNPDPEVIDTFPQSLDLQPMTCQPLWFAIEIPRDAAPGTYKGKVTVRSGATVAGVLTLTVLVDSRVLPDPSQWKNVPDIIPNPWSVARYVEQAGQVCDEILSRGKLPILVGGTGLYIDSLIAGRDFADNQEDRALRTALEAEYDRVGGERMLEALAAFDPERAAKLGAGDKRRIVRAIEIYRLTGKTATEHDEQTRRRPPRYEAARIVLNYKNRADLYDRIDRRVMQMVEEGLFDEVQRLLDSGLSPACTAMQAIGYKEAVLALRGEITRDEAAALIQQGSRRYAKRQITWFGRWQDACRILWDGVPDFAEALRSSTAFLRSRGYHE